MIKKACCLALLLFTLSGVFAQETIDKRLLQNRGKQAEEAFKYNKNSYNYYLFELDNSHWVASISDLDAAEKQLIQPAENFKNNDQEPITLESVSSEGFNFYEFHITLSKVQRLYIALDNEHVLVFYSIPELTKSFTSSASNTK